MAPAAHPQFVEGRTAHFSVVSQSGAALVTTLLAVTLLTIAVVEFAYSSQVDYHLAHNALKALQANYLARSGVNLAMLVLKRDGQSASGIDSLRDEWAYPLPPLPAGEGMVMIRVSDEQGKVNLNALRNSNGTINRTWRDVAERLFALREIEPGVLDPLLDWLDVDDFPEPRGAERDHYSRLTPPYVPANGLLLTLGELGRIEGFSAAMRTRLAEVITVLPGNNTLVNVNTAPGEVLAALFPMVDRQTLETFLVSRIVVPVRGVNELRERLGFDPKVQTDAFRLVSVRSEFFAVTALASVDPVSQALSVIVQRRAATVTPMTWQTALPLRGQG
ncbi:MAG: general secretion pathway protein GspK [Deltaproteobacteria bacterium]|nr:general secretion pathway protein GspK [Deltaproteobacteria bacterium]